MLGRIPRYFDRNRTTKIRAAEGWIYVKPVGYDKFYVTATGMRAETFPAKDIFYAVTELASFMGGVINESKIPTAIVDNLLENHEDDFDAQEFLDNYLLNKKPERVKLVSIYSETTPKTSPSHKPQYSVQIGINSRIVHQIPLRYGNPIHYLGDGINWLIAKGYFKSYSHFWKRYQSGSIILDNKQTTIFTRS